VVDKLGHVKLVDQPHRQIAGRLAIQANNRREVRQAKLGPDLLEDVGRLGVSDIHVHDQQRPRVTGKLVQCLLAGLDRAHRDRAQASPQRADE
jgi:hypothetical protein